MAWANLCDVRCYYETAGLGDSLLLIAGLGQTCRSFDPVLHDLAAHFSVIAPDNRGMGQSKPHRVPSTMAALAADLVELLDHLQVERTHVLGISMGGVLAQRLAVDHPGRISKLVLISCTDRFTPYLTEVIGLLARVLRRFGHEAFHRVIELLGTSPWYLDSHAGEIERRVRDKCLMAPPRMQMARQLQCLACSEIEPDQYRIACPTLVVAGEHDVLIPSHYARQMADKIPHSRFVELSRAGHNPFEECPERIVPGIIHFLKEGDWKDQKAIVEPRRHEGPEERQ